MEWGAYNNVPSSWEPRTFLPVRGVEVFGDECADLERGLVLLVFRVPERVVALAFDLDLVMESSEVMRRHPPHHLSPARQKPRQGKTPKRTFAASKSP